MAGQRAPPGRLTPEAAAVLSRESSDLARNLEVGDPDWHGRRVRRLGACPLSGRLLAFDPIGVPGPALHFPVEVTPGVYPAYVLDADGTDLMVVRFGGGRPVAWQEVRSKDGSEAFFFIEAATYAISDESAYDALAGDAAARDAAEPVLHGPGTSAALPGRPELGLAISSSEGDQPAWGYVGLTVGGEVAAVAVALVTDCVYRYRPASQDAAIIAECERLVAGIPADDPDEDEIRSWSWPSVRQELETKGALSADGRNALYEVYETLRTDEE